jgi:uncharacterized protein YegJ (DUF2314 family)
MTELISASMLRTYKIPITDQSWDNFKPNYMVKITLHDKKHNESFWVWIESIIDNTYVIGIISNNIISNKLEIGQKISFHKDCIKEISNRSYTKDETDLSILMIKSGNNPITKYFESLNIKFNHLNTNY